MKINESQRKMNENQWKPMNKNGNQWKWMQTNENELSWHALNWIGIELNWIDLNWIEIGLQRGRLNRATKAARAFKCHLYVRRAAAQVDRIPSLFNFRALKLEREGMWSTWVPAPLLLRGSASRSPLLPPPTSLSPVGWSYRCIYRYGSFYFVGVPPTT